MDTTFDHNNNNNNNNNNENNVSIIIAYEFQPNLLGWPTDLWDYPLGARTQLCDIEDNDWMVSIISITLW